MYYDIEADWNLLDTCSYCCSYCYVPAVRRPERPPVTASIQSIAALFNDSGLTWLLHITGGEPFLYPRFVELCQILTQRHAITVNTNLSLAGVQEFATSIAPERVSFVNCGLHIQQREQRNAVSDFIEALRLLQQRGFVVMISYVIAPELFDSFQTHYSFFLRNGIVLIAKALQGYHDRKPYRVSYTPEQRQAFLFLSQQAKEQSIRLGIGDGLAFSINPFLDRGFVQEGLLDYRGTPCGAGSTFVRISRNGDSRRCGARDVLGNVANGVFERRAGPSVCNEDGCPYFCVKYALPDTAPRSRVPRPRWKRSIRAWVHALGRTMRKDLRS